MKVYASINNPGLYWIFEGEPDMSKEEIRYDLFFAHALVECDNKETEEILSHRTEFRKTWYGWAYCKED